MDNLEMVRVALVELGDVSAEALAAFVEEKYGVKIEPKFIPLFKASIRDKRRLEMARQAARATLQAVPKTEADTPIT